MCTFLFFMASEVCLVLIRNFYGALVQIDFMYVYLLTRMTMFH